MILLYILHLIDLSVSFIYITLLVSTKTAREIAVTGRTDPLQEQNLCITTCLTLAAKEQVNFQRDGNKHLKGHGVIFEKP